MDKKVRTAVVGVGHLGKHHARWLKNIPCSELVGVFDIDVQKRQEIASELSVTAFSDLSEIFKKVDAVSIVVSTTSHYEIAKQFLEHGINCLVEKPITATKQQAESLLEIAARNNAIFTVGHIERFNPAIQALKNFDINPRFIEAHRLAAFNPRGADVAVILDLMIHDIELALYLIKSDVERVEASAVAVVSETADIANARLIFKNGAVANLTASRISLRPMRKLRLFQKSAYYSIDLALKEVDVYRLNDGDEPTSNETIEMKIPLGSSGREIIYSKASAKNDDMLSAELTSFVEAVKNKTTPEVSALDATKALEIALEIEKVGMAR